MTIESRLVESEKRSEVLAQEAATRHEVVLASKKQKQRSQIFKGRPLDRITDDDPKKLPHWFSRAEAKVKKMNEDIEDKELQYDILSYFDGNLSVWWSTQEDEFIGIKTWSQIKEHIFRHFGLWDLGEAARTSLRTLCQTRSTNYRNWDETFMTVLNAIRQSMPTKEKEDSLGNKLILDMWRDSAPLPLVDLISEYSGTNLEDLRAFIAGRLSRNSHLAAQVGWNANFSGVTPMDIGLAVGKRTNTVATATAPRSEPESDGVELNFARGRGRSRGRGRLRGRGRNGGRNYYGSRNNSYSRDRGSYSNSNSRPQSRGRSPGGGRSNSPHSSSRSSKMQLDKNQCARCLKDGHWARECRAPAYLLDSVP